jgi:hypothetical protein
MPGTERKSTMNFRALALSILLSALMLPYAASQTAAPTLAASALTAVPPLIPYSGQVEGRTGQTSATFLIYKDQTGGEPLFTESQMISFDPTGHYKVQLGAANPNGLPSGLFATGEARWLEVQVPGQEPQPRVLLASVPYALKAADAATLGGLPASAFALAGTKNSPVTGEASPAGVVSSAGSTVTTTGGVSDYLPRFSGASTVVDSQIFDNGTDVGIGTASPTAKLDVNGNAIITGGLAAEGGANMGGSLNILATGTATASAGKASLPLAFVASSYSSSANEPVPQIFRWIAAPTGNDTASPSSALELLFSTGSGTPAATGLSINGGGRITFAPGQTFPGTGKITSVGLSAPSSDFSVSGSPVTGAGNLGLNWNVAPTSADKANAIVKRDASGSFTAGAITATLGMEGVTSASTGIGVAGIHNGGGTAVSGVSLQAGGIGLYGDGTSYGVDSEGGAYGVYATGGYIGVVGYSTNTSSANADGVHGVTASGLASGVAGVNNAGGVGVYGTGGTGVFGTGSNYGFVTDTNVSQARTAGGWVKAMVEIDAAPFSIPHCFNSTLTGAAATTPPCGIDVEHQEESGTYDLNFNFEVDDRFYTTQILYDSTLAMVIYRNGTNSLQVLSYYAVGDLEDANYQLIIY